MAGGLGGALTSFMLQYICILRNPSCTEFVLQIMESLSLSQSYSFSAILHVKVESSNGQNRGIGFRFHVYLLQPLRPWFVREKIKDLILIKDFSASQTPALCSWIRESCFRLRCRLPLSQGRPISMETITFQWTLIVSGLETHHGAWIIGSWLQGIQYYNSSLLTRILKLHIGRFHFFMSKSCFLHLLHSRPGLCLDYGPFTLYMYYKVPLHCQNYLQVRLWLFCS